MILFLFLVCVYCQSNVIIFTFDAEYSITLFPVISILDLKDVKGTFFYSRVKTLIGTGLSIEQYRSLFFRGHEIGGQTLNGVRLSPLPLRTAIDEVCYNRKDLIVSGFTPKSFGFIENIKVDDTLLDIVKECGYNLAATNTSSSGVGVLQSVDVGSRYELDELKKIVNEGIALSFNKNFVNNRFNSVIVFRMRKFSESGDEDSMSILVFSEFVEWLVNETLSLSLEFKTLEGLLPYVSNETDLLPLPPQYVDVPRGSEKLLPETMSKLIIASATIGAMIIFIFLFFLSERLRNKWRKHRG